METKSLDVAPQLYTPLDGYYAILVQRKNLEMRWHECRELFCADVFKDEYLNLPENGFLFKHGKSSEGVEEFINRFEYLLEVGRKKPICRSQIKKIAGDNKIVWVEPGPFWLKQPMRFSLYTMLFRCAIKYNGDFFGALVGGYDLAMETKASIMRFLDGYTWYTGKNDGKTVGWHDTFYELGGLSFDDKRWKILIRPNSKEETTKKLLGFDAGCPVWESSL